MDTKDKGLELACRFSSITNRLRYCGPKDAYRDFYLLLKGKKYDRLKIEKHFRKYEGLFVYLEYIAKKHRKNPFDYEVIESYWLGNELLESFSKEDLKKIILALVKRGLPKSYADSLIEKMRQDMNGMLPHHSFNVLYVGVGKTTGSVPTNIMTMNKCIVSVGTILKILKEQLLVSFSSLKLENGTMVFSKPETQYVEYIKDFFPSLKIKDKIAIHWDFACKILSLKEEMNLKKYTQKNIDALNSSLFFSSD
jgi:hypothetical protein